MKKSSRQVSINGLTYRRTTYLFNDEVAYVRYSPVRRMDTRLEKKTLSLRAGLASLLSTILLVRWL